MSNLFSSYRKKGFEISLRVLEAFDKAEATEKAFLNSLGDHNSYFNDFYRSKKELLDYKLISYKLDEEANKILYLTEKGKDFLKKIDEINELLNTKFEKE